MSHAMHPIPLNQRAWRIAIAYLLAAALWLGIFECGVKLLVPPFLWEHILIYVKDWALIGATSVFLGLLIMHIVRSSEQPSRYLKALANQERDHVMIFSPQRRLIYTNHAWQKITGYSMDDAGELYKTNIIDYCHPDDRNLVAEHINAAFTEADDTDLEFRVVAEDGVEKWVHASWHQIRDEYNKPQAIYVRQRDVTALKALQEQIEQSQARTQQSDQLATLGRYAAGLAHDLNNPLMSILGYTQILLESTEPISDRARADLSKIEAQARWASRIVTNMLALSRPYPVLRILTDINDIVIQTIDLRMHRLQTSAIEVDLRLRHDLPMVNADPFQLQRALLNIIINAEQALTRHKRRQDQRLAKLTIETRRPPDASEAVELCITDNGPGISEHISGRVLQPFFTTKADNQGIGLGLTIANDIIREHDGQISIDSKPGQGTTITITLNIVDNVLIINKSTLNLTKT